MNKKNLFGYLLVTAYSIKKFDAIAQDYWFSTLEMNNENRKKETKYYCFVVCLNCSWWQRLKLSLQTGIPMRKISDIRTMEEFGDIVAADSLVDDDFFGRTKVFALQANIPRSLINSCIEVVYAE